MTAVIDIDNFLSKVWIQLSEHFLYCGLLTHIADSVRQQKKTFTKILFDRVTDQMEDRIVALSKLIFI